LKRLFLLSLSFFFCIIVVDTYIFFNGAQKIIIDQQSSSGTKGQIFWSKSSGTFSEDLSTHYKIIPKELATYKVQFLPRFFKTLRFDFIDTEGTFTVKKIEIVRFPFRIKFEGKDLKSLKSAYSLEKVSFSENGLIATAQNNDPSFILDSEGLLLFSFYPRIALIFLWTLLVLLFRKELIKEGLEVVQSFSLLLRNNRLHKRIIHFFDRLSEDQLIIFTPVVVYTFLFCIVLAAGMIVFRLHLSSLSIWAFQTSLSQPDGLLFGIPRAIRSDEWLWWLTDLFSQINAQPQFPNENVSIGVGKTPLLMNLPARHFSAFFRPQFWGFFFFSSEVAFSLYWAFKTVGLFLSTFFVLLVLLNNAYLLSLIGALWFYYSSYTQWWLSGSINDVVTIWNILLLSLLYILFARSKNAILLAGILCLVFSVNFVLVFYPPYQIPLFYLLLFIILGKILKEWNGSLRTNLKLKFLSLTVIAFSSITSMLCFFFDVRETIHLVQNTYYPGQRRVHGGTVSLMKYFYGFFDLFFYEKHFPQKIGNVCEGSSFILLWYMSIVKITKEKNPLYWCVLIFTVCTSLYMLLGFPSIIEKILFLNLVQPERSLIALGYANILLTALFLGSYNRSNTMSSSKASLYALLGFGLLLFYAFSLNREFEFFFRASQLITASLGISFLIFCLLNRRVMLFAVTILLFTFIPNHRVNPLAHGIKPLLENDINNFITNKLPDKNEEKWAVFGDRIFADLIKATGVSVFNGVKYSPDLLTMQLLDPEKKFFEVYNRYAHINLSVDTILSKPNFHLIQADFYTLSIDQCSEDFKKLGITNLIFIDKFPHKPGCLVPLNEKPLMQRALVYTLK
jgi:hypothetical protein